MTAPVTPVQTNPNQVTIPGDPKLSTEITTAVGIILAVVAMFHPGFQEPTSVQLGLSILGGLIASGMQLAKLIMHRQIVKAAIYAKR